ncbi:MAG TPA: hypothetical protein VHP11_03980, partial [Tepidisphaeraceae bacterium]|nr:hypothetical protein [Tepidisphaeraceae bacterium]
MHRPDACFSNPVSSAHRGPLPDDERFVFRPPTRPWLRTWPIIRSLLNRVGAAGMAVATLGYAWWSSPFDVEYSEIPMPLRGLAQGFEGFRIVQVTDLHTG